MQRGMWRMQRMLDEYMIAREHGADNNIIVDALDQFKL